MAISDDVIYGGLLVLSIPFGLLIRRADTYQKRQNISTAAGVLIVLSVCGIHSLHSLITSIVNALIIIFLGPRNCHVVSFVWCFGYIVFFRMTTWFGLPQVPPHANAIQLILTLKLVGLAYEVHDSYKNKNAVEKASEEEKETAELKYKGQLVMPSFVEMLMYSYCYIGVLTGPYFKYRTYYDMLHEKNTKNIDMTTPLLHKLKWLPLFAISFILLSKYFSIKYCQSDEFYEQAYWFRFVYMIPMFFIFRLRFYCAWFLSECMCITAALGAYPAASKPRIGSGPTDYKALKKCDDMAPEGIAYNFEVVHNIDPYGVEFAPTVRSVLRTWNMTVQYWMASTVYKRLPMKSHAARSAITMFVSAFWHGIHPGYHLSMLTTVPAMIAEDLMAKSFRDNRPPERQRLFDGVCWFVRCRIFDYMSMGFLLLTLQDTCRYWGSLYYAGHVWTLAFIAIGYMYLPSKRRDRDSDLRRTGDEEGEKKSQ